MKEGGGSKSEIGEGIAVRGGEHTSELEEGHSGGVKLVLDGEGEVSLGCGKGMELPGTEEVPVGVGLA